MGDDAALADEAAEERRAICEADGLPYEAAVAHTRASWVVR